MELVTLTADDVTDDLNPETGTDDWVYDPQTFEDHFAYNKAFLSDVLSYALRSGKESTTVSGPFADYEDQIIAGANLYLESHNFLPYHDIVNLLLNVDGQKGIDWAWDQIGPPKQQITSSGIKLFQTINPFRYLEDVGLGVWDLSQGMWGEVYEDLGILDESDFSDYVEKAGGRLDDWWEDRAKGYAPNPYAHDNWFDRWMHTDDWTELLWLTFDILDMVGIGAVSGSVRRNLAKSAVQHGQHDLAYELAQRQYIKKDLTDPTIRGEQARPIVSRLPDEKGVPVVKDPQGGEYGTGKSPVQERNLDELEIEMENIRDRPFVGDPSLDELVPDIDMGNGMKVTHPTTWTPPSNIEGLTVLDVKTTDTVAQLAKPGVGATRSFVLIEMPDGTLQPWYRSTSQNSGKTEWFPFDGFGRATDNRWIRKPKTHKDSIEGGTGRPEGHQEISDRLSEMFDDVVPDSSTLTNEQMNAKFGTLNIPEYHIAEAEGFSMRKADFADESETYFEMHELNPPEQKELFQFANEDEFLDAVEAHIESLEPGNMLDAEMARRAEADRVAGRKPDARDYHTPEAYEDAMIEYEGTQQELFVDDKPLKHFTTAEGRAGILATGHDPTRPPLFGTGYNDAIAGGGTGKFAGNRLYLSLDDTRWGEPTLVANDEVPTFVSKDEAPDWAVPVYDYEKQEWMYQVTGFDEVALESVEYTIKPEARKLVIDSGESYEAALREARSLGKNQNLWLTPEASDTLGKSGWDALSKKYDVIEIRNVDELADGRNAIGRKFFQAAGGDQVVVLNQNAVELVMPKARPIVSRLSDKVTNVHYGKGQNKVLSNFHEETFTFNGRQFLTAEGAYHAYKTGKYVNGFQRLTGKQAKDRARKMGLKPARGENKAVMRAILKAKYKELESFRTALDETSGMITHDPAPSFWAETFPEILMDIRGTSEVAEAGVKNLVNVDPHILAELGVDYDWLLKNKPDILPDLNEGIESAHRSLGHSRLKNPSSARLRLAEIEATALALRRLDIDPKFLNSNPKKVDIGFRQGKPKKIKAKNEAKKLDDQSARDIGEESPRGKLSPPMKNRAEFERWKAKQEERTKTILDKRTKLANRTEWKEAGGLTKIISGGQIGIDQAGLRAAKAVGLETGGVMPKGQLVYDPKTGGKISDPKVANEFGLTEHTSGGWLPRTEQNVKDANGTLIYDPTAKPNPKAVGDDSWIERKWGLTSGSKRTVGYATKHGKPYIVNPTQEQLIQWIQDNNIQTLNIAGPRFYKKGQSGVPKMFEEELIQILELLITLGKK